MPASGLFTRYRDLQTYVGWTDDDAQRVRSVGPMIREHLPTLIDDFYAEIARHSDTARLITGGPPQIELLKSSLRAWLVELLECRIDADYVARRWSIGLRHAEIGLRPAYTSVAMARLKHEMAAAVTADWQDSQDLRSQTLRSLNKLLDLDLAIIQDAYEAEYLKREKLAEHERSEVKFRRLVEAAACMVVILKPDHKIAYMSPYGEDLTGYSAAEVIGRDFSNLFLPGSARAGVADEIHATLKGKPTRGYENPILRRDGSQRWLVWNWQRLDDYESGAAILAVGHDLTERREAEEGMLRSERLAGIGQMITGLAHESRNALQRIQSCSEMLELEMEENSEALRLVRRLQEAQDHLLRLFDEVRGYAAPIQLERTMCDLASSWREAWHLLETSRRGRRAKLVEQTNGVELGLELDRFRVVQTFRNVLENSLAACSDPIEISIECREVELEARPAVELRIRDNGPGLSPEARRNVFEPFFTTKTKGTGLGMAIARRIVDAHQGRITVGDGSVKGAEFVITLPRTAP